MPADRPTCATCKWWKKDPEPSRYLGILGSCHRYAPRIRVNEYPHSSFAPVGPDDWCGEHSPVPVEPTCANHPDRVTTYDLWKGMHLCDECWIGKAPYA